MQDCVGPDGALPRGPSSEGDSPPRVWAQARFRLAVLLPILAGLAAFGIPKILAYGSTSAASGAMCQPRAPEPATWSLARLRNAVAMSGLVSLSRGATPDIAGLQAPAAAWTDGFPSPKHDPSITTAIAGYELRWWSVARDHQVADLFVFQSDRDATRYVDTAGSTRCHREGTSYPFASPFEGKALVWHNPDGFLQADVFFSQGDRAYRIGEVPPADANLSIRRLIGISEQIACQLPDAACYAPRA